MNVTKSKGARTCPKCQVAISSDATECWMCNTNFFPSDKPRNRYAIFQFRLSSLLILITIVSGILGIYRIDPRWAILLTMCITPSLLRVWMISANLQEVGESLTLAEKTWYFFSTLGIILGCVILFILGLAPRIISRLFSRTM